MNVLGFFDDLANFETHLFQNLWNVNKGPGFPSVRSHSETHNDNDTHKESHEETHNDTQTLVKEKPKLKRPPLYKVILLNDDYTPMEFVILVLMKYFAKTPQQAEKIMLDVHQQGSGIAGIYPFEVAETKVFSVNEFSRRQKHPLKCIMEEDQM